jgi:hypothetical protein
VTSDPLEPFSSTQHVPLLSLKQEKQTQAGQYTVAGGNVWEDRLRRAPNIALNGICLKWLSYLQLYEYLTRLTENRYSVHTLGPTKQVPEYIGVSCVSLRDPRDVLCCISTHISNYTKYCVNYS